MLPNRVLMERAAWLQDLYYVSLKFLIKISLNKEHVSLLSKALRAECPSMFPKSEASIEIDAHFQSLTLHILRGLQ
jgi:hypothetical protein